MGLYEILKNHISMDRHALFGGISLSVDVDVEGLSSEERIKLEVIRNALSIFEKVEPSGAEFSPAIIIYGDKRTFGPQDFTDDDYKILKGLDFASLPVTVRAKIADLLWVEKKEYICAKIALSAYNELFELWFSEEDWIVPMEIMDRILCISAQISDSKTNISGIGWGDNKYTRMKILDIFCDNLKKYKDGKVLKNIIDFNKGY